MSQEASGSGKDDVARMMSELGISDQVLDDVVFEDEELPPIEPHRWMALARVHVEREYSQFWFFKNMCCLELGKGG